MKARDVFAVLGRPKAALGVGALVVFTLALGVGLAGAVAPTVTIEPATAEYTTAHVEGKVKAEDHETSFWFEYITDAQAGANEGNSEPPFTGASEFGRSSVAENETAEPAEELGGLSPETKYRVRLVAENSEGERVEDVAPTFETKPVAKPSVTIDPVSGSPVTSANFSGTVDANAPTPLSSNGEAAYRTEWHFECEPISCSGSLSGAIEGEEPLKPANNPHNVSGEATGLQANTTYKVKLVASNAGGSDSAAESAGQPVEFTTPAVKPDISPATLWEPTPTSIQLNAYVNAHSDALTDCHFEYGTGGVLDQTAPCEAPVAGETFTTPAKEEDALVSARVSGLTPGSAYQYRLVAENPAGTDEGSLATFETGSSEAPAAACSNQDRRIEQHAEQLTHCRAYEQVSPVDKSGADIVAHEFPNVAASDGNAISYLSTGSFADTIGTVAPGGMTRYLSRRGPEGWTTHAIDPRRRPEASQVAQFTGTEIPLFSEDLRTALVWGYDLPDAIGGVPGTKNLYLEDTETRGLTPIAGSEVSPFGFPLDFLTSTTMPNFSGLSADARSVLITAKSHLLSEAAPGVSNVYEWTDGSLHLVNVLPTGEVPSGGGIAIASQPFAPYRGGLSRDGSRAFFLSPAIGERQLYLRIDNTRTVWVSEPEGSGPPPSLSDVSFQSMTSDGKSIFFVTSAPLVNEDKNEGPDIYRYTDGPDPEHEAHNLTLITHSGDIIPTNSSATAVVGTSEDGTRVYYQNMSRNDFYMWDDGETRLITHRVIVPGGLARVLYGPRTSGPGAARVSADGRWLAFFSNAGLFAAPTEIEGDRMPSLTGTPIENVRQKLEPMKSQGGAAAPIELYLYDAQNKTLRCTSCPREGVGRQGATVFPNLNEGSVGVTLAGVRPNYLLKDGSVVFTAGDSLSPSDTDGVGDVYEYDPSTQAPSLLSPGHGADASEFTDASANGDNVFFFTRRPLVGSDADELVDLYDVRVGGGLANPVSATAPCSGEACQGVGTAPAAPTPPHSQQAGSGNVHAKRHHRRHRSHTKRRHRRKKHRVHGGQRMNSANGRIGQ